MERIETGAGAIAYERSGAGGADPTLLLLHGIPGSHAAWAEVRARLGGERDVLAVDLLGFGESARPVALDALHAAGQARALGELLDRLGVARVAVAGHDFGGPVAVMLAAQRPAAVTRLALLAANVFPDTPIPFPLSTVTWPVIGGVAARALFSRPSLRMMLRSGTAGGTRLDPAIYLGDAGQVRSIRLLFQGSLQALGPLYEPIAAALRAVRVPALVGWGTADPFFPLDQGERTAAALGAALRVYDGAGHFLPAERPDAVAADLSAWLDGGGAAG